MFFTKILLLFRKKSVAIAISFLIEGGIPVVTPVKTGKIASVRGASLPSIKEAEELLLLLVIDIISSL